MVGKNFIEKIALERIYRLFELAEEEFENHSERSKRYVELARKISERNRARIPKELKDKFCKKCGTYLKKGKNAEIIIENGFERIVCKECGYSKAIEKLK